MHVLRADETFPLAGFEAQVRRERPCGRIGSRLEWNLPHPVAYFYSGVPRSRGDSVTGNPPAPVVPGVLLGVRQGVYILLITRHNLQKWSS